MFIVPEQKTVNEMSLLSFRRLRSIAKSVTGFVMKSRPFKISNAYLEKEFPRMDYIKMATIVP